jgi:hypothetical protein
MNCTLLTAASSSAAGRRPSGEIAAAWAWPPIALATASTRAAVNDTITFFIGFCLVERTQPTNNNIYWKFQITGRLVRKESVGRLAAVRSAQCIAANITKLREQSRKKCSRARGDGYSV